MTNPAINPVASATFRHHQRRINVQSALQYLDEIHDLHFVRVVGSGSYGDIVELRNKETTVAGKIVHPDCLMKNEFDNWQKLIHPDIIPLQGYILIQHLETMVYLMPLQLADIRQFTLEKSFKNRMEALGLIKMWLKSILRAVKYLHNEGLCHLDVTSSNILIGKDSLATLSDFSTLQSRREPVLSYGASVQFSPPEATAGIRVEGTSFDSWCLGTLAFELFTGHYLLNNVPPAVEGCDNSWCAKVYPKIYEVLQGNTFERLVRSTMPAVHFNDNTIPLMFNFVLMFLHTDPKRRPCADFALEHEFLEEGYMSLVTPDPIWLDRVSQEEMDIMLMKYNKANQPISPYTLRKFDNQCHNYTAILNSLELKILSGLSQSIGPRESVVRGISPRAHSSESGNAARVDDTERPTVSRFTLRLLPQVADDVGNLHESSTSEPSQYEAGDDREFLDAPEVTPGNEPQSILQQVIEWFLKKGT